VLVGLAAAPFVGPAPAAFAPGNGLGKDERRDQKLLAFDCSTPTVQQVISTDEVEDCNSPEAWPSMSTYGTVLRAVTSSQIKLCACSTFGTVVITRCGMYSHSSIPIDGVTHNFIEMGREVNHTVRKAVMAKGKKESGGECRGESLPSSWRLKPLFAGRMFK